MKNEDKKEKKGNRCRTNERKFTERTLKKEKESLEE